MNSKNKKNIFKELIGYLIVAIIAALFAIMLRFFVIEPYIVPTPSMSPTLLVGDKVIVNKLKYKFSEIQRGDVVAFYSPYEEKYLVKRVIGLPGENITCTREGKIFINGADLNEKYIPEDFFIAYEEKSYNTGDSEYFLMGDNRNNSSDSRVFGNIEKNSIFGKVFFIYGPFSRIGKIY